MSEFPGSIPGISSRLPPYRWNSRKLLPAWWSAADVPPPMYPIDQLGLGGPENVIKCSLTFSADHWFPMGLIRSMPAIFLAQNHLRGMSGLGQGVLNIIDVATAEIHSKPSQPDPLTPNVPLNFCRLGSLKSWSVGCSWWHKAFWPLCWLHRMTDRLPPQQPNTTHQYILTRNGVQTSLKLLLSCLDLPAVDS